MPPTPKKTAKATRATLPEELRDLDCVPTFLGREDEETGKDYVQFPPWFTRTGVRTCEVDSGLGKVILRACAFDQDELESNSGWLKLTGAILSIPDWQMEYDYTLVGEKGERVMVKGESMPSPKDVYTQQDELLARNYWDELLPPSLAQQVIASMLFMRLPPLVFVPKEEDPRGE